MDAFTKLPDSVKAKYNLSYKHTFEDFVIQEVKEGGSCEKITEDLKRVRYDLRAYNNEYYSHPFFTDSQVQIISDYVEGGYAEALIKKTEKEALDFIYSTDGLLRCIVALGDENLNQQESLEILNAAINQLEDWQEENESESAHPER